MRDMMDNGMMWGMGVFDLFGLIVLIFVAAFYRCVHLPFVHPMWHNLK
jgi:hypothetical protein